MTVQQGSLRSRSRLAPRPRGALAARWLAVAIAAGAATVQGQGLEAFPIEGDTPLPERMGEAQPLSSEPLSFALTLDKPGYVTLVVEDAEGRRVANFVSAEWREAGEHVFTWDGLAEDSTTGIAHGINDFMGRLAAPGTYTVRGLVRDAIDLRYEFSAYTAGSPPWTTRDGRGRWLADHSPPADVLYLPGKQQVLIVSPVAEAGDGLVWAGLDGRKRFGRRSVGGGSGWWGGYVAARDAGENAADVEAYKAGAWRGYLELWTVNPHRKLLTQTFDNEESTGLEGLAVHNRLAVLSLSKQNQLLFVDTVSGDVLGKAALDDPRGVAFDARGRLVVLSGQRVLRFAIPETVEGDLRLPNPEVVVDERLADPQRLAFDAEGNLYVSDRGDSHQVKVFDPTGALVRTIGTAGGARLGPYDETRMDRPLGVTVTEDNNLWVAEYSYAPKRVSIWTLDGTLVKAMYGPPQYGGGGSLDTTDKTKLYYARGGSRTGLEFALDWDAGTWKLANVYALPDAPGDIGLRTAPQSTIEHAGRRYMTNAHNSNPTGGTRAVGIWENRGGTLVAVAAAGRAEDWPVLEGEAFAGVRPAKGPQALFAWSDRNGDGRVQPEEVTFTRLASPVGSLNVTPELVFVESNGHVLRPESLNPDGVPLYDANAVRHLAEGPRGPGTSGGGETLLCGDGWLVNTGGPMRGYRDGRLKWTYPSYWPSLHATHGGYRQRAPAQQNRGQMVGTTRLLGIPVTPRHSDAGEIWAVNSNVGTHYLLTSDGLFVDTLYNDRRIPGTPNIDGYPHERGMKINAIHARGEHFWPTINQLPDGSIRLVFGFVQIGVVRVEGLESIRRIAPFALNATADDVAAAHAALSGLAARTRYAQIGAASTHADAIPAPKSPDDGGRRGYRLRVLQTPPVVDAQLDDWEGAEWMALGEHPTGARMHAIEAAAAVDALRLHVAYKTGTPITLEDREGFEDMLLRGGAFEVLLATDRVADSGRKEAAAGDVRLMVGQVKGTPAAYAYTLAAPGETAATVVDSGWRSTRIGRLMDLSEGLAFAHSGAQVELSLPLDAIGLQARPGDVVRADVGWSRPVRSATDGMLRVRRHYWHNDATYFTADPAGEALLAPHLWGEWRLEAVAEL